MISVIHHGVKERVCERLGRGRSPGDVEPEQTGTQVHRFVHRLDVSPGILGRRVSDGRSVYVRVELKDQVFEVVGM
jgi:hypothetical protein